MRKPGQIRRRPLTRTAPSARPLLLGLALLAVVPAGAAPASAEIARDVGPRSGGLSVEIMTPGPAVEAGVPFTLTCSVGVVLPPVFYLWNSSELGTSTGPNWTVTAPTPSTAEVSVEVADASGRWGFAEVNLTVESRLGLNASLPGGAVDAGEEIPLTVDLEGGVPPYSVSWTGFGPGPQNSTDVLTAGTDRVPVVVPPTGPAWVHVSATDAAGGRSEVAAEFPTIYADPALELGFDPTWGEVGQVLTARLVISGGVPPVTWSVATVGPLRALSPATGDAGTGEVGWTAVAEGLGNASILVNVTDAGGRSTAVNRTVPIVRAVVASLLPPAGAVTNGTTLDLLASVADGVPPYAWTLRGSDGELERGNLSAGGNLSVVLVPGRPGALGLSLTVSDALGYVASATLPVSVSPSPPPGSPTGTGGSTDPTLPLFGLVLGGIVLAALLWRGRGFLRRGPPRPSETAIQPPDPLAEVAKRSGGITRDDALIEFARTGHDTEAGNRLIEEAVTAGSLRETVGPRGTVLVPAGVRTPAPPAVDRADTSEAHA